MAFKDIIGQEKAIELLKSYIKEGRPHHSYLFVGPKGVGKTTCALNFAKLLNCEHPSEDDEPCDNCRSCEAIDKGYHPDVQLVSLPEEKREIGIDEIREVRQSAYTSAAWGKWKVYIIERAEVLTREASDALLKILEEPPERCLFILLAPNVGDVPPTIASRCHIVHFPPVKRELIARFLERYQDLGRESAYSFASLAEGRPGYAIALAMNDKMRKAREKVLELIAEMPLNPDYALKAAEKIIQIAEQMAEEERKNKNQKETPDTEEVLLGEQKLDDKSRIQQCLLFASSFFRDLLLLNLSGDEDLMINLDQKEKLKRICNHYNLEFIHSALNHLQRTYRLLQPGSNVNHRLALEVMFLDILGGR